MTTSPHMIRTGAGLFIAGTDAACGKTTVAAAIIHRLQSRGVVASGLNPAPSPSANRTAVPVSVDAVRAAFDDLHQRADCVVVEGVGGWTAQLGPGLTPADLARALALPVLLIVDPHPESVGRAQSSARAIRDDGLQLAGWIANSPDRELQHTGARLASLKNLLDPAPCLGVVDHHAPPTAEAIARHLRFDRLMAAMGFDQAENQSR